MDNRVRPLFVVTLNFAFIIMADWDRVDDCSGVCYVRSSRFRLAYVSMCACLRARVCVRVCVNARGVVYVHDIDR